MVGTRRNAHSPANVQAALHAEVQVKPKKTKKHKSNTEPICAPDTAAQCSVPVPATNRAYVLVPSVKKTPAVWPPPSKSSDSREGLGHAEGAVKEGEGDAADAGKGREEAPSHVSNTGNRAVQKRLEGNRSAREVFSNTGNRAVQKRLESSRSAREVSSSNGGREEPLKPKPIPHLDLRKLVGPRKAKPPAHEHNPRIPLGRPRSESRVDSLPPSSPPLPSSSSPPAPSPIPPSSSPHKLPEVSSPVRGDGVLGFFEAGDLDMVEVTYMDLDKERDEYQSRRDACTDNGELEDEEEEELNELNSYGSEEALPPIPDILVVQAESSAESSASQGARLGHCLSRSRSRISYAPDDSDDDHIGDDSEESGSDYEETEEVERKKAWRSQSRAMKRGKEAARAEREAAQAEQNSDEDDEEDPPLDSRRQYGKRRSQPKRAGPPTASNPSQVAQATNTLENISSNFADPAPKALPAQTSTNVATTSLDNNFWSDLDLDADDQPALKRGRLSKAHRREAMEVRAEFDRKMDEIATKSGHNLQTIYREVGDLPKKVRKLNPWNVFQIWLQHAEGGNEECPEDEDEAEWTSKRWEEVRKEKLGENWNNKQMAREWMEEWWEPRYQTLLRSQAMKGTSKGGMKKTSDMFISLAQQLYRNRGLICYGWVVDIYGEHSCMWGAGAEYEHLRMKYPTQLTQQIKDVHALVRTSSVELRHGDQPENLVWKQLCEKASKCEARQLSRDGYREVISEVLRCDLASFVQFEGKNRKFPWSKWPDYAFKHKVRIVGWPADIPPPGNGLCNIHNLKLPDLKKLMEFRGYLMACYHAVYIGERTLEEPIGKKYMALALRVEKWDEKDIELSEDDQADVAVVIDNTKDRVTLASVRHAKNWTTRVQEVGKHAEKSRESTNFTTEAPSPEAPNFSLDPSSPRAGRLHAQPSTSRKNSSRAPFPETSNSDADEDSPSRRAGRTSTSSYASRTQPRLVSQAHSPGDDSGVLSEQPQNVVGPARRRFHTGGLFLSRDQDIPTSEDVVHSDTEEEESENAVLSDTEAEESDDLLLHPPPPQPRHKSEYVNLDDSDESDSSEKSPALTAKPVHLRMAAISSRSEYVDAADSDDERSPSVSQKPKANAASVASKYASGSVVRSMHATASKHVRPGGIPDSSPKRASKSQVASSQRHAADTNDDDGERPTKRQRVHFQESMEHSNQQSASKKRKHGGSDDEDVAHERAVNSAKQSKSEKVSHAMGKRKEVIQRVIQVKGKGKSRSKGEGVDNAKRKKKYIEEEEETIPLPIRPGMGLPLRRAMD